MKDFCVKFDVHGDVQTHAEEDLSSKQYENRHDRSHDEQFWFARAKKGLPARILTLVYVVTWGHILITYNLKENIGLSEKEFKYFDIVNGSELFPAARKSRNFDLNSPCMHSWLPWRTVNQSKFSGLKSLLDVYCICVHSIWSNWTRS